MSVSDDERFEKRDVVGKSFGIFFVRESFALNDAAVDGVPVSQTIKKKMRARGFSGTAFKSYLCEWINILIFIFHPPDGEKSYRRADKVVGQIFQRIGDVPVSRRQIYSES